MIKKAETVDPKPIDYHGMAKEVFELVDRLEKMTTDCTDARALGVAIVGAYEVEQDHIATLMFLATALSFGKGFEARDDVVQTTSGNET